jgi:mono/diheme cytochrome c family protein
MNFKNLGTLVVPVLLLFSCNKEAPAPAEVQLESPAPVAVEAADPAEPVVETASAPVVNLENGKRLYMINCISCHNRDPNIKGSVGPEVVDAPLEVMTSKILTGVYPKVLPPGFVPKRKSSAMRKIPRLEKDIPSIYAWIQSVKKK